MGALVEGKKKRRRRAAIVGAAGGAIVRRGASAAARAAMQEKHTLTAVAAAALLGYARRMGYTPPTLGPLSPEATAGLAAWAIGRFTKNRTAEHVATGLLAVAAHDMARGAGGAAAVAGDDMGADDVIVGEI